ncbi:TrbI/VirB10 family protein [Paenochrobactrum glaciei]|uniref:Type IV secretion system protein virB10 n=1 Tax=Paenochrobactrum glaciei TaxID=486407 RepID=A0ABN1GFZ9_9HYPH
MSDTDTNAAPMHLRAEPPRVTRLSRKMLVSVAAVAMVGISGVLIYALQTRAPGDGGEELYSTANRQTADGLAGLPRDYTGPVLGPALPGQPVAPPVVPTPGVDEAEQRRLAEEEAARLSTVFFQSRQGSTGAAAPGTMPGLAGLDLGGAGAQPTTAQDRQLAFLNAAADRRTVTSDRVTPPASPFVLQVGAVISAALITGIRSDLPGQITAQVTENIYDSPTGSILLVPQGTRLIGQYDNSVEFGQRRVLLVWNRLILPNGRSMVLERQLGADPQGFAGLEDGVDYHWWDLAKAAALSTLLGVGAELATDDNDRLIRAIRDGAQDTINQAGQQIVQRQLQVAPTLTIRPGFPVRVIVTRDLVLEPYRS